MKKMSIIFASIFLTSCSTSHSNRPIDYASPRLALDWPGVYQGVLPCADCEGIKTTLTLHQNGGYKLEQVYEKGKGSYIPQPETGQIEWDKTKPLIYLKSGSEQSIFFVGENKVIAYDTEGNPIVNGIDYSLRKIQ